MRALLILMLLLPLIGSLYHAVAGNRLPRRWSETIAWVTVSGALVMAVSAAIIAAGKPVTVHLRDWFAVDNFTAGMGILYDPLAAAMAIMVTFIAVLTHIFSIGYLHNQVGYARYYCFLNLFVFFMLVVVTADNLLFLFLGLEGIGFCSYVLIGFRSPDSHRVEAAGRAFVLTRIGSAAFGITLGIFFFQFGTLSIAFILSHATLLSSATALWLGLLLLLAAAAISALLPLSAWLPGAMAGPTPVSALLHAAAMVTAGVFLLLRLYPVVALSPTALGVMAAVGAITALYGACSALAQQDIKRVLAYSTISQVGFMVLGVGVQDPTGALYHLFSQAFFKTLLFLAAGCIIHSLGGEHDIFKIRKQARKRLPEVLVFLLIGASSLAAVPPTMGFFSRDRLLLSTLIHPGPFHMALWGIGMLATLLTAIYIFRLFFLIAYGGSETEPVPAHPLKPIRPIPLRTLYPLAGFALFGGLAILPIDSWNLLRAYLNPVPGFGRTIEVSAFFEWFLRGSTALVVLIGIGLAYFAYGPSAVKAVPRAAPGSLQRFLLSGFSLNWIHDQLVARPYQRMAQILWRQVDEGVVDETMIGVGRFWERFSMNLRVWTTGRLSTYIGALLLGFVVMLSIIALGLL